jgi:hypothetical protein
MFRYAIRVVFLDTTFVASLIDWPEVTVRSVPNPDIALKTALLKRIDERMKARAFVPVPKSKPTSQLAVQLAPRESMKVMVFNEMICYSRGFQHFARRLELDEATILQAISLDSAALDVELLDRILNVMGKRLIAYAATN